MPDFLVRLNKIPVNSSDDVSIELLKLLIEAISRKDDVRMLVGKTADWYEQLLPPCDRVQCFPEGYESCPHEALGILRSFAYGEEWSEDKARYYEILYRDKQGQLPVEEAFTLTAMSLTMEAMLIPAERSEHLAGAIIFLVYVKSGLAGQDGCMNEQMRAFLQSEIAPILSVE